MISIVIAAHGDPRLLDLTLEAAAQATAADVEYVLVGDVEAAVARRAGQPQGSRLVTVHRPDLGRVAALNEGLARTSGEVVSLLASGDLHFQGTLCFVRPRFYRGLLVQGPRRLPFVQRPPDGADSCASR
jgi:glycosyltransferase involved in cell wall biosynthesis